MKIVADEKIPYIKEYFGAEAGVELILRPGRKLTREDVVDADMLIVRSITTVNRALLHDTAVKFVGSVVTGLDHLDTKWLDEAGIRWYAAQGCNAVAVSEYVVTVVAVLEKLLLLTAQKSHAGVVGVGRVGSLVAEKLKLLGFAVTTCDPLRALNEANFQSTPFEKLADLDLISLHTPLTRDGAYPTYHMVEKNFLQRQKKQSVLLNAGRGSTINFADLDEYGKDLYWCLDVWENEPAISLKILQLALLATPHIAGHSLQAKQRGIEMVYQAACQQKIISPKTPVVIPYPTRNISFHNKKVNWHDVILEIYDPRQTTVEMKEALIANDSGKVFDTLRNQFNERHEFSYVTICEAQLTQQDKVLLRELGLRGINELCW